MPRIPRSGALLALLLLSSCAEEGPPVRIEVTQAEMLFCAGSYHGSVVRLSVRNDSTEIAYPERVEFVAAPEADIGEVRGDLDFDVGIELPPDSENAVLCEGGLPGPLAPPWGPEEVPVAVILHYRLTNTGADAWVSTRAVVTVEQRAAACAWLPSGPCRTE